MLQQRLISIDDKTQWQKELLTIPHAPAHVWEYNQAITASSKLSTVLYCATAPGFKAICPLSIREKAGKLDIVTPYGFGGFSCIGTFSEFERRWHHFFQKNYVCGYIALHPLFNESHVFQTHDLHKGNNLYMLDLTASMDTIIKGLSKAHRYELRQWQKRVVSLITAPRLLLDALVNLYQETLIRVNAAPVYHFEIETLSRLIVSKNAIVIGAFVEGKIEAVSVFLYTKYIADYYINASTLEGRSHTRGLLLAGIEMLQNLSIPLLNLGGGITKDDGLDSFKKGFGGVAYGFNALKQVFNRNDFERLCRGIVRDNNYFPPYYV